MQKVDFYFDFLSPFSYFAWIRHQEELSELDLEVNYLPVLMGSLFSAHGFLGPGQIRAKRAYELKKCFRYAKRHNISFTPPAKFPFNPMAIIRVALISVAKNKQKDIIDLIFKEIWEKGHILEDPEEIESFLKDNGYSNEIFECSFSRPAKKELKANIKKALDAGIFGVPSFATKDEFFWGNDSFVDLKDYLLGYDNWDKKLYNEVLNANPLEG